MHNNEHETGGYADQLPKGYLKNIERLRKVQESK
jgi:hypothetical protein